jgi:hypothetical protein
MEKGGDFMKAPAGRKRAPRLVVLGIAAAALALRATGQVPAAPASAPVAAPDLAAIDARLHGEEWEAARTAALARVEAERANPAALELARAVSRLALAEAGLGRQEDALWHWGEAQNLDRAALSPAELASFGAAGELLAHHPLRHLDEAPAGLTVYRADDLKLQSPIRTAGELPKLAEDMGAKVLRIQGIVDSEGRFREPVVLGEGSPDTIYRVLEALREWRYTAAQRNYRSVASFRSVYVGNLPPPKPLLRLGHRPPKPGPRSRGPVNPARTQPPWFPPPP